MTVFCVNGEKYNRIKALLCSEKRLAYNGLRLAAGGEKEFRLPELLPNL